MKKILAAQAALFIVAGCASIAAADFIDTTGPTGDYYQYANFLQRNTAFLGGQDVDTYGNTIYVNRSGRYLDVYTVSLADTDGDGAYEPDQHPSNPNATGPMEARTLTFQQTYNVSALRGSSTGEIYAASDRVYFLGDDRGDIYQYIFATDTTSKVVDAPYTSLSQLGYDDVNDTWYASSEGSRTVYSWDGASWVNEFSYSSLAGSHMDGLEVVTDPNTNVPYVYVSDMTSDYLGQWRYDNPTSSWVEANLFQYAGSGNDVEGLGFGALGHFWATGWSELYEIGGGDLGGFIQTPPPGDTPNPAVPEPATMVLFGIGLAGLAGLRRRKNAE